MSPDHHSHCLPPGAAFAVAFAPLTVVRAQAIFVAVDVAL